MKIVAYIIVAVLLATTSLRAAERSPAVRTDEFIFATAPFRECHASTIVETSDGLLAAWFGGTAEGEPDVSVWLSRRRDGKWTAPRKVADGVLSKDRRHPCWNPVLFQPADGPLMLFYKVGPNPRQWWGMLIASTDGGRAWSKPRRLPDGFLGPIKNKPLQLPGGDLLCPSSSEDRGWRVHFERTGDLGRAWQTSGPVNDGRRIAAIQPAILVHADGRLQAVGRTKQKKLFSIFSTDGGKTWGEMTLLDLPNPNSGVDAMTLRDGRHLLVYNHATLLRSPLNVALSSDGQRWTPTLELENALGEFSYPAVIQSRDGLVHIVYTWRRQRIKHVALDPRGLDK
ncbi:MAG: exo-alpha-sialidase [Pirellulales bacterium]|nr:exo-alpha-sialidase [Pirellulales bacterium]